MSFLYFAYGSNLLTQRMTVNCTSARFKCIGELKNFKFLFGDYHRLWNGGTATIVECKNDSVWGAVWEISKDQEELLKIQEDRYEPTILPIENDLFGKLDCQVYRKSVIEETIEKPSWIYKAVIVQGAKERGLPLQYIKYLEAFQDNGFKGPVDVPIDLDL